MIAFIEGKLVFKSPTHVHLLTGGVAYHINISLHTFSQLPEGEFCRLHTHLIVKEDSHTLFGFVEEGEKKLFGNLILVSGIGPNTARIMLSSITPTEIQQAIIVGDVPTIQRIKGIGPKTAQRVILELQDKLKKEGSNSLISMPRNNTVKEEALSAMIMLGFAKSVAEKVVSDVSKIHGEELSVEQLIKISLKSL